jgi:hypothetical protein
MKIIFTAISVCTAFTIGAAGLAAADDTPATATTNPAYNPPTPQSAGGKFVNSNGSLTDKNGNRIDLKGNPLPTLKQEKDEHGNSLDQNGMPIHNGLSSRTIKPKKHTKKHTSPMPVPTPKTN